VRRGRDVPRGASRWADLDGEDCAGLVLLPSQYVGTSEAAAGEKRLLAALLVRTLQDWQRVCRSGDFVEVRESVTRAELEGWLFLDVPASVSLATVCAELDLDIEQVRRVARRLARQRRRLCVRHYRQEAKAKVLTA
jgi:hypothetical protein